MVRHFAEPYYAWAILDAEEGKLAGIGVRKDAPLQASLYISRAEARAAIRRLGIAGFRPVKVTISYEVIP
jgi:hypothetical protein